MSENFVCWKCGTSIDEHPLPLSRTAECSQCHADLYVCKLCRFYNTSVSKSCIEPVAEEVKDKERANFCDYLELKPGAHAPSGNQNETALAALEELFGGKTDSSSTSEEITGDPHLAELESLFKK